MLEQARSVLGRRQCQRISRPFVGNREGTRSSCCRNRELLAWFRRFRRGFSQRGCLRDDARSLAAACARRVSMYTSCITGPTPFLFVFCFSFCARVLEGTADIWCRSPWGGDGRRVIRFPRNAEGAFSYCRSMVFFIGRWWSMDSCTLRSVGWPDRSSRSFHGCASPFLPPSNVLQLPNGCTTLADYASPVDAKMAIPIHVLRLDGLGGTTTGPPVS